MTHFPIFCRRLTYELLIPLTDSDGSDFVMPAQAGVQQNQVFACGYTSWSPGLTVLARNDVTTATPQNHCAGVLCNVLVLLFNVRHRFGL
jgi:hypothetical protein